MDGEELIIVQNGSRMVSQLSMTMVNPGETKLISMDNVTAVLTNHQFGMKLTGVWTVAKEKKFRFLDLTMPTLKEMTK